MVLTPPQREAAGRSGDFGSGVIRRRVADSLRRTPRGGATEVTFQALGTQCRILLGGSGPRVDSAADGAVQWVADFEAKYSRFLPGSLISRINAAAGVEPVALDAESERLFALCHDLHFLSRGIFDPTALPVLQLWNWKANPPMLPTDRQVEAARSLVGWKQVQRTPGRIFLPKAGMGLDLGGMGKEYAVDQVALLLRMSGVAGALVDFGADIRVFGTPPDGRPGWHIGLEDPQHPGACWRGLAVRDAAVATSGDYRRAFELNGVRYGHIVDPRTGRPVTQGVRAVSVLAPSCTQAGLLSTAAFVLGPDEGLRLMESTPGTAGAILTESQTLCSRRFHEHVAS